MDESEQPLKRFGLAFLLAVICYAVLYVGIESCRPSRGPWEVTFRAGPGAPPSIEIKHYKLGITNVRMSFVGAVLTNAVVAKTLRFDQAQPTPFDLPFGTCIFLDTTFLPGTVTARLFGHEIELLPRTLIIDHAEHPWKVGESIELPARPR